MRRRWNCSPSTSGVEPRAAFRTPQKQWSLTSSPAPVSAQHTSLCHLHLHLPQGLARPVRGFSAFTLCPRASCPDVTSSHGLHANQGSPPPDTPVSPCRPQWHILSVGFFLSFPRRLLLCTAVSLGQRVLRYSGLARFSINAAQMREWINILNQERSTGHWASEETLLPLLPPGPHGLSLVLEASSWP